jgi:hypothetical protein
MKQFVKFFGLLGAISVILLWGIGAFIALWFDYLEPVPQIYMTIFEYIGISTIVFFCLAGITFCINAYKNGI